MGQAKARGSYEQRKAEAIQREKDRREARDAALLAEWQSLTEEERQSVRDAQIRRQETMAFYRQMLATCLGVPYHLRKLF